MEYYDRYQSFRENGQVKIIPYIKLNEDKEDVIIV